MSMGFRLTGWIGERLTNWLTHEHEAPRTPLCDFERIRYEIRPCDVILVEGRSRVSDVIKNISQSPWTHSALYIGRIHDIDDADLRKHIQWFYDGDIDDQLVVEALMGQGTIVSPLKKYEADHLRICRPDGLARPDAQKVISYAAQHLGCDYNVRQLLDLARFIFPYGIVPRRWRSTLFERNAGIPTRTVCSSIIASAFNAVHFPILPVVQRLDDGEMKIYKRNSKLYTPRDFDYSPYFDIIKYPFLGIQDRSLYRQLPWDEEGRVCNGDDDCFAPEPTTGKLETPVTLDPIIDDKKAGSA